MRALIEFFTENFMPYDVVPSIALTKRFILKNGYSESDILLLIKSGEIEENESGGYKLTKQFIKEWVGSSYKYVPEFIRE